MRRRPPPFLEISANLLYVKKHYEICRVEMEETCGTLTGKVFS